MTIDVDKHGLAVKYRPQDFDGVVGQDAAVASLKTILDRPSGIPHGFFFQGPAGTGKTTLGRILAKKLGCSDLDFKEYDSANTRGIDTIREIIARSCYKPLKGPVKVYLLDEVHKITNDAQNALLKSLEEPPDHCYFILCTTDPQKVIKTIKSRCTIFQLSGVLEAKIVGRLKWICEQEGITDFPVKILRKIAQVSEGSVRNAIRTLDTVLDIEDDEEAFNAVQDLTGAEGSVPDICKVLLGKQNNKWEVISKMFADLEGEPEGLRMGFATYFMKVLLGRPGGDDRVAEMMDCFNESVMYTGKPGLAMQLYLASKV